MFEFHMLIIGLVILGAAAALVVFVGGLIYTIIEDYEKEEK